MSAPVAMDLGASPDVLLSQDPASEQRPVTAARDPPHGISADVEPPTNSDRASPVKHVSNPAYNSPLRHHRRNHSAPRQVKESLNARSEYITSQDDGVAQHRINQYIIKQEIGRGSFGAVHLAVDQYNQAYAVKEFSKSRLRKRAQSHILRQPNRVRRPCPLAAGQGFNAPLHKHSPGNGESAQTAGSAIDLIKEEIAIMKKLNHDNLVSLIEVLDDPTEDSLYMVMEMCKKGVVMKVGLDEKADPYPNEQCRHWFRDLILGIEYLHAQGVVHRDIKPDNCLLTNDDVLKIVDFGVSEMFEKQSEMLTAKSAGSPAFLPPELCIVKHGDVSGKAADIWSMGVTLYCLKFGRIPFEKPGIFELFESIKNDDFSLEEESDEEFRDLIGRLLEKDPSKRIRMPELRAHPWVTRQGSDPLLSEEENTADVVEAPTEEEMNHAITGKMTNLITVMKAANKFKSLTAKIRPPQTQSILGDEDADRFFQPPLTMQRNPPPLSNLSHKLHSVATHDRPLFEGTLDAERVPREIGFGVQDAGPLAQTRSDSGVDVDTNLGGAARVRESKARENSKPPHLSATSNTEPGIRTPETHREGGTTVEDGDIFRAFRSAKKLASTIDEARNRGHAHDPLEDHLYLFIGPSTFSESKEYTEERADFAPSEDDVPIVSESPGAADIDIYETAYRDEIERIVARTEEKGEEPQVYLTRRVDARLLAISGWAGRFMAAGEEKMDRFQDFAKFKERKARVTEVSRALRGATKEEYTKRKEERRRDRKGEQKGTNERAPVKYEEKSEVEKHHGL